MTKLRTDQAILNIKVDAEVHRDLKVRAALAGISMTELVIQAIENYTGTKK